MKKQLFILTIAAISAVAVKAQHTQYNADGSHYQECVRFSESEPISELAKKYPVALVKHERTMPADENAPRRKKKYDPSVPFAPDGARQMTDGTKQSMGTIASFDGETSNDGWPLDPNGAADSTYYVQTVNSQYSIWNKSTHANVAVVDLKTLFGSKTCDDGDPVCLYDKFADRWVITEFQENGTCGNSNIDTMLMAVSETSSPTGKFYIYRFCPDNTDYADYPKYTVWQDGYYQTCNCQNDKVVVYDRKNMIKGVKTAGFISIPFSANPLTNGSGDDDSFFCPMALDADGSLPPSNNQNYLFYFTDAQWGGSNTCAIKIFPITVNWTSKSGSIPATASQTLATATFDSHFPQDNTSFEGIDQPGGSSKYHSVDPLDGFFNFRIPYMRWTSYNSALMANVVNVGTHPTSGSAIAGIRWYELRQDTTTKAWSIFQQGTYAPSDNVSRWDPGVAMDNNGSIGLEYCVSDPTSVYPGIRFTGRTACDAPGTMSLTETSVVAGTGDIATAQGSGNRWGDYTKMCIDPSDGITFWATTMYSNSSCTACKNYGNADTRIFSFQITKCNPTGEVTVEAPQTVLTAYQSGSMLNVSANKLPQGNNFYVELFDIDGKKIAGQSVMSMASELKTTFNVSSLAKGVYFVRIGNDNFQRVVKVPIN